MNLFSYFWPFSRRYYSEINGELEVSSFQGRKVLNSKNANYSYGPLQEVLEYGLSKIDLEPVRKVLILGLGGGSAIESLRKKFRFKYPITAVEIDPEMIRIARKEFRINTYTNLEIVNADALQYAAKTREKFDLILIDLFIDTRVPQFFYEEIFCGNISRILTPKGVFLFNMGMSLPDEVQKAAEVQAHFGDGFEFQTFSKVYLGNFLLIGKKK